MLTMENSAEYVYLGKRQYKNQGAIEPRVRGVLVFICEEAMTPLRWGALQRL